jgi:hypothetical protein
LETVHLRSGTSVPGDRHGTDVRVAERSSR